LTVDLHSHTTASDGSLTPTELVRAAQAAGLGVLAVTDHDTVAGVAEAQRTAEATRITLVPGVELSAEGAPGKCHLLGLFINPEHDELCTTLAMLSRNRRERNEKIVGRLRALGVDITMDEVVAAAPDGANVGRPHFAQALVDKGVVPDINAAFARYLADEGAAYVEKATLTPAECAALVHRAGGLCLVAHPGLLRLHAHETREGRLKAYSAVGIDGIEAYYSQHSPADEAQFVRLAEKHSWLVSGGSDFHGAPKPHVPLGIVRSGQPLSKSLLSEPLRARLEALVRPRALDPA
jgi:3',5'-nucleoside bisphosphate phosphatase